MDLEVDVVDSHRCAMNKGDRNARADSVDQIHRLVKQPATKHFKGHFIEIEVAAKALITQCQVPNTPPVFRVVPQTQRSVAVAISHRALV